jgi:hypothetical protein
MSTNINHHVFHGFLSNFGYVPNNFGKNLNESQRLWYKNPIHFNRAFYGAKKPFATEGTVEESKITEFENEKDALIWYKKNRFGKIEYEKILNAENNSEEEDIFCKNYFLISESEFGKYKNYFHGMIKFLSFQTNLNINYDGSYEDLNDCAEPCSSSSSSVPPDTSSPSAGLDLNNILDLLEDEDLVGCCRCPPCGTEGPYNCFTNIGLNINLDINFDSSKIFEIESLEKRVGALYIDRYFSPYYGDYTEESERSYIGTVDEMSSNFSQIFLRNWVLNSSWDLFFKDASEENNKKFSRNATVINDPVILPADKFFTENPNISISAELGGGTFESMSLSEFQNLLDDNLQRWRIVIDPTMIGLKSDGSGLDTNEIISTQSQVKQSDNLGNYLLNISSNNSIVDRLFFIFDLQIKDILYIKSEKKYMCFMELDMNIEDTSLFYINRRPNDPNDLSSFEKNSINFLTLYSTDDSRKQRDNKYLICPDGKESGIKLKKVKIPINIGQNPVEIEVWSPEVDNITSNRSPNDESYSYCQDSPPRVNLNLCSKIFYTKKWNFSDKFNISLIPWSREDFSKLNTFPIKKV